MYSSQKPIGIFDSGLGGITALKAVREILPHENIIYLGDSARLPYGDKTASQITQYVCSDVGFLMKQGIKALLIACNTADSIASVEIKKRYSLPVVGVVVPAGLKALEFTKNNKIGVIATNATVKSGTYEKFIKSRSPEANVFSVAASRLVPLIEQGKINKSDREIMDALDFYLEPLRNDDIDTLILGCTHYPLIYELVADMMPDVNIICSGTVSANLMKEKLDSLNLLNTDSSFGSVNYYITGDTKAFGKFGSFFMNEDISQNVTKAYI